MHPIIGDRMRDYTSIKNAPRLRWPERCLAGMLSAVTQGGSYYIQCNISYGYYLGSGNDVIYVQDDPEIF